MRKSSAWSGSNLRMIVLGLMLIAVTVSGLAMIQQSPETKPAQAQEAKAKPGASEMKRLGFYVGNLDVHRNISKVSHGAPGCN
jgi:predicted secreted protein